VSVSVSVSDPSTLSTTSISFTRPTADPTVTLNPNGKSATLIFSGYNTPQPLPATNARIFPVANYTPVSGQAADYRANMTVTLQRGSAPNPRHTRTGGASEGDDD
jgi:hypothetical protein